MSKPSFSFNFAGTNDNLIIDTSGGNPVPAGGITFNGGASSNDTLTILGSIDDIISPAIGSVTVQSGGVTGTVTFNNAKLIVTQR